MKKHTILFLVVIQGFMGAQPILAQVNSKASDENKPLISSQQAPCATPVPDEKWEKQFSQLISQFKSQEKSNSSTTTLYTIPVIVHVIHGGQTVGTPPNLAQGQINSQIRVLNEDFGGVGFNSGSYPASAFSAYAVNQSIPAGNLDVLGRVQIANCNVQFCLATKDSLGNTLAEPGIDRINYISKGWSNPTSFGNINAFTNYVNTTIKPQSIWNVTKYFNIWISDANGSLGLLGYATFPAFANLSGLNLGFNGTPTDDGIWCYSYAFGSGAYFPAGTYSGVNNRGRTTSHEAGHWLGLRHIWGDGTCASDFCGDTPPASGNNFGSPSYPYKTTNCTGNTPNGEMFMNFMDYVNDNAKYMFTPDQALRVQTAMANCPYRAQLGTHNLCSVANIAAVSQFNLAVSACQLAIVSPVNNSYGTPVPSYTWSGSGGASFNPNANTDVVTINFPGAGIYTITLAADNGTISVSSKTIEVKQSPILSISGTGPNSSVCMNDNITLIAGGANSYTWEPGTVIGDTFNYVATSEQTISCTGINDDNCRATTNLTITVSECVGLNDEKENDFTLTVSPNPVVNELRIQSFSQTSSVVLTEVSDISGKLLSKNEIVFDNKLSESTINFSSYQPGLYFVRFSSENGANKTLKIIKE